MADLPTSGVPSALWLARPGLQLLLEALADAGYAVLGPRVREGSVVLDEVRSVDELPIGWRDTQEPGSQRLERTGDQTVFGVVHGPGGLKRQTFAPREVLIEVEIHEDGRFEAQPVVPEVAPRAVLGVRACDLAGLQRQDRIFLEDRYPDPVYEARREGLFLVAVNCTRSVSTCFCASVGTGPAAQDGFDLSLTELVEGFVARAGSDRGREVLGVLGLPEASEAQLLEERSSLDGCAAEMERSLPARDLRPLLYENLDHPRWDEVAERCLSCGNCTLVCPTCFCHDQHDEPTLDGSHSTRVREWDSCFDPGHAQIHGINFRPHVRERYRQWLVHKLASWIDQFGDSGCVGCGRCITWCPVGIDLTEEVRALGSPA